jgi:hypothetical protein
MLLIRKFLKDGGLGEEFYTRFGLKSEIGNGSTIISNYQIVTPGELLRI